MAHYDPIRELDDLPTPTVSALADHYDIDEPEADMTAASVQAELAGALNELGPQTMDDGAKLNAVRMILKAMQTIDALHKQTTELEVETVTETIDPDWSDDPIDTEYDQAVVQCHSNSD